MGVWESKLISSCLTERSYPRSHLQSLEEDFESIKHCLESHQLFSLPPNILFFLISFQIFLYIQFFAQLLTVKEYMNLMSILCFVWKLPWHFITISYCKCHCFPGLVVESAGCSSQGSEFGSKPHGGSSPSLSPVLRSLMSSSSRHWHQACMWCTETHAGIPLKHIRKIK